MLRHHVGERRKPIPRQENGIERSHNEFVMGSGFLRVEPPSGQVLAREELLDQPTREGDMLAMADVAMVGQAVPGGPFADTSRASHHDLAETKRRREDTERPTPHWGGVSSLPSVPSGFRGSSHG